MTHSGVRARTTGVVQVEQYQPDAIQGAGHGVPDAVEIASHSSGDSIGGGPIG
jgi:hypothetical protein